MSGRIEPGEIVLYRLPDLEAGQWLFVHAKGMSANLDPFVGLVDADVDPEVLEASYEAALEQAIAEGADPLVAVEGIREEFLLAWDDDGGGGLTAALQYEIPADGDYRLLVGGALSVLGGETFGDYGLLVGLDAPQALDGEAEETGDTIAILDVEATPPNVGVQEIAGTLTPEKPSTFFILQDFRPGDTLYVYVEAISGDLNPTLSLQNFARKPLRSANLDGREPQASLQYTFPTEARNYRLNVGSCCDDEGSASGELRLLAGVNTPEVLTGTAETDGRAVVRDPIEVQIGVKVDQIIDVDQKNEYFTAVASMRMEWTDPKLAFNPETCQCDSKPYTESSFAQFLADAEGAWPDFTFQNQQGNRWSQNRVAVVSPDGHVIYFERFTTNFQVDFDFRQFPFDTQEFVIRVESVFPEEFVVYAELSGYSEISQEHGEDEFILTGYDAGVTRVQGASGSVTSRFTLSFTAPRHLNYYIFQVFVPILLIITVSWVTFFLKDYGRRIEVASANLLLFIAFSWSLADNYPRLGYLTFLDAVMAIMFVINALVVVYNVWLRRLEMKGLADRADRIDSVLDWVYPVAYIALFAAVAWWFF